MKPDFIKIRAASLRVKQEKEQARLNRYRGLEALYPTLEQQKAFDQYKASQPKCTLGGVVEMLSNLRETRH